VSLTAWPLLTLAVGFTVAAFVGVVVAWPTLAGRRLTRALARAGLLVLVNGLVLLTAAIWLNDQFLFFADWTDLRGATSGATTTTGMHGGGRADRAAAATVTGPAALSATTLARLPAGLSLGDHSVNYTVTGPASGITGQIVVTLPPGYSATAAPGGGYPVLEAFGGYPSQLTQWIKGMKLPTVLSEVVTAHHARQALIVTPQVQVPPGADSECVNGSPGRPQVETWISQDVPAWVAAHFRVTADRSSWATIGLSAGGWCAAMVTMLHPAQFSAAIVLGGYFRPDFGSVYQPYPVDSPLNRRYDLVGLARRASPPVAIWLETSHADPLSYTTSASLLKASKPPLSVSATVLQNAGHRFSVWQNWLPTALTWLGSAVPGFRPLSTGAIA
jgi:enterochelin esterase-like enzyme